MRTVKLVAVVALAGGLILRSEATPATLAAPQGIQAAGVCSVFVQNMDESQSAVAILDFYKQNTGAPVTVVAPPIPASAAWGLNLGLTPQLSNGAFAAIASGDRQLAGAARCFWAASGGDAAYVSPEPGTDVVLPLAMKGARAQTSLVTIQNTDPNAQASATYSLYSAAGDLVVQKQYAISAGSSMTLDLGNNPDFAAVPPGTYWAMVRSATPLAVQSYVDLENSQAGVYDFEGVPRTAAATQLAAPAVFAAMPAPDGAAAGDRTTWMSVVNAGPSPLFVTVAYTGIVGVCAGQTFSQGPWMVLPNGQQVVYAGSPPSGATGIAGPLPAGCAAAAWLETTGGRVIGVAVEEVGQSVRAGAYTLPGMPARPAPPPPKIYLPFANKPRRSPHVVATVRQVATAAQSADWRLHVPTLRRAAPEEAGAPPMTSEVTVMNMADHATIARMSLYGPDGSAISCDDCAATLPPRGAHRWWLGDVTTWLTGTVGSAVIASEQPLVATVADYPLRAGWDETLYSAASISQVVFSASPAATAADDPWPVRRSRISDPRAGCFALPLLLTDCRTVSRPTDLSQLPERARQFYPILLRRRR